MKRQFIILVSLVFAAVSSFAADNSYLLSGNAEYESGNYDKAIGLYEKQLQTSESGALYYNLGNAYYKKGSLAPAILNYERAILREPDNDDIKANLEIARSKTLDDIKPKEKIFFAQWYDDFVNLNSSDSWAVMSVVLFLLTLTFAAIYLYVKIPAARRIGFFGGIGLFICTICCMCFASSQKTKLTAHNYVIIFNPSVEVKTAPEAKAGKLCNLHEGTKVKLKQTRKQWIEIDIENGNTGWIQEGDARKI